MTKGPSVDHIEKAYVLGAGFSKAFGLPLVQDLLDEVARFCREEGPGIRDRALPQELDEFRRRFFPFFSRVEGYQPNVVDMFVALEAAKDLKQANVALPCLQDIDPEDLLRRMRTALCQVFHQKLAEAVSTGEIGGSFFTAIDRNHPPIFSTLNCDNSLERGLCKAGQTVYFFDKRRKSKPGARRAVLRPAQPSVTTRFHPQVQCTAPGEQTRD